MRIIDTARACFATTNTQRTQPQRNQQRDTQERHTDNISGIDQQSTDEKTTRTLITIMFAISRILHAFAMSCDPLSETRGTTASPGPFPTSTSDPRARRKRLLGRGLVGR
eukprot:7678730-Alexandrium_andersonii.AAC.1